MSLIVLNSKGQDPAEFENHGLNLKLGKETQMCLVGVNLNRTPKSPLQIPVTEGNNNGWIVANGGRLESDHHTHAIQTFSIREGVYTTTAQIAEMTSAMGGSYYDGDDDKMNRQPISCWRKTTAPAPGGAGGLFFTETGGGGTVVSLKASMNKLMVGTCSRLDRVFGAAGGAEFPDPFTGMVPSGINEPGFISTNLVSPLYTDVRPSNSCKNFIDTDPLWNTSNDATQGAFAAGGAPLPADGTNDGWLWATTLPAVGATDPNTYAGKIRGGVISSKWTGAGRPGNAGCIGDVNTHGPQGWSQRWGMNGNRFDLYWEVSPRSSVGTGYEINFYSTDLNKGPEVRNDVNADTLWGSATIPAALLAAPGVFEICMRPISTVANGYRIEAWVRQRAAMGGNQVGAVIPATAGAAPGFYQCTGNHIPATDLYNYLPLFQGISYREQAPAVGIWSLSAIKHNTVPNVNGFPAGASIVIFSSAAAARNNVLKISCCWSEVKPNYIANPDGGGGWGGAELLRRDMAQASKRYTGIASTIGFQCGTIQEMPQATTAGTGVAGDTDGRRFEGGEKVAVVQIPNIPLHGELGSGSTVWGGSNGARVLGVVSLRDEENQLSIGMNAYTEPSFENWIDVGNMSCDALNQIQVRLTDAQGRKLISLYPNTTVWLKVRSKQHGGQTRTGGNDMRGSGYAS